MATIQEIIERVDDIKPNAFTQKTKMAWIAELDGKIAADVMMMGAAEVRQLKYVHPGDLNRELLVDFPHDSVYELWLCARIDFGNGEYSKYQNSMEQFNAHYGNFVRWFAAAYEPAQGGPGRGRTDPPYYLTAYGLAVKQGFEGTLEEWLDSLKGDAVELRVHEGMIQWRRVPDQGILEEDADTQGLWTDLCEAYAPGGEADCAGGFYELDLREIVEAQYPGEDMAEQQFDITDRVDVEGLMKAVEDGRTVRVRCTVKMAVLMGKHEVCVVLTEEAAAHGDTSGTRVLSGIGLDMFYAVGDRFDYHFFRLYMGTDADGKKTAAFSFTPASLNRQLQQMESQMVRSVNGMTPDEQGNVDVAKAVAEEVLAAIPAVTAFAVTEAADSVTVTVTGDDGTQSTVTAAFDAEGYPVSIDVDGRQIPVSWEVAT